jgi:hypothetical protein
MNTKCCAGLVRARLLRERVCHLHFQEFQSMNILLDIVLIKLLACGMRVGLPLCFDLTCSG